MIDTGNYLIQYYNKKGTKLKSLTEEAFTLMGAREVAEEAKESTNETWADVVSYTIDRRLANSLD